MLSPDQPRSEFRLEIPFLRSAALDCGPIALEMALRYLSDETPSQEIRRLVNAETSGVTATVGIAAAAAELGYHVTFSTTSLGFNPANHSLEYYQQHLDSLGSETDRKIASLLQRLAKAGGIAREQTHSLDDIESQVRAGAIAIVLLDWHKLIGAAGYGGHFVPIVGFHGDSVLVHHSGGIPPEAQAFFEIRRQEFDRARSAAGTDQDIVFIRKGISAR